MSDLIWLNGEIISMADARIGVEDRGYQFADGVYEVIRLYNAKPFTLNEHLARLHQSAQAIGISLPLPIEQLSREIHKLIAQNNAKEAMVYLQLTRGVAPRNHQFPDQPKPTLLFYTRDLPPLPHPGEATGAKICSVPDERWKCCWIKSIALLPNVLAKNHAIDHGFDEAAFVEGGLVSECSSSNLFAIFGNTLVTHPAGPCVLPGITRAAILDLAPQVGLRIDERPVRESEISNADELFITSTTREISWVSHYNQSTITPRCGQQTLKLHQILRNKVVADTQ
ncbi:MAG: aminotransferase class IV [Phycisphaerales bacterium]|jgi:D-alanine transaminase|nr:aminotransferase class IV [Phycisphaerales bacterium]